MEIKRIETGEAQQLPLPVTYAPVIKTKNAENAINIVLYITVFILFCAILSTYFVEDLPNAVLDLKDFALDALWVIVGGYAIGELFKRIFMNKARATKLYDDAKKTAKEALEGLTDEERERREEYCGAYEENVYVCERNRILKDANISNDVFMEIYAALSVGEIKKRFPENTLTKKQYKAIRAVNRLKRIRYNADFLNTTIVTNGGVSPSEMYNVEREDKKNALTSAIAALLGGVFGVSIAGEMVFSFSAGVFFSAVIKTIFIVFTASFKANFGWNLVIKKEINRYLLQAREVKNLKLWCAQNPRKN